MLLFKHGRQLWFNCKDKRKHRSHTVISCILGINCNVCTAPKFIRIYVATSRKALIDGKFIWKGKRRISWGETCVRRHERPLWSEMYTSESMDKIRWWKNIQYQKVSKPCTLKYIYKHLYGNQIFLWPFF